MRGHRICEVAKLLDELVLLAFARMRPEMQNSDMALRGVLVRIALACQEATSKIVVLQVIPVFDLEELFLRDVPHLLLEDVRSRVAKIESYGMCVAF